MNITRLLLVAMLAASPCLTDLACGEAFWVVYDPDSAGWVSNECDLTATSPHGCWVIGTPEVGDPFPEGVWDRSVGMPEKFKECSCDENE